MDSGGVSGGDRTAIDELRSQPQSAPPSLAEPSYYVLGPNTGGLQTTTTTITTNRPPTSITQVIEVRQVSGADNKQQQTPTGSRRNSNEISTEPIVEVKNTSSSSSLSSSNSSTNQDQSTKLVRRRTVRRYHRATELDEQDDSDKKRSTAELTISINAADQQQEDQQEAAAAKSHFRTRQIGSYLSSQGCRKTAEQKSSTSSSSLSTSTSTSKIAKCSITTNRKSTTSQRVSSQQKADEEQQVAQLEMSRNSGTIERRKPMDVRLAHDQRNGLFETVVAKNKGYLDAGSSSIAVREEEEEEESSVRHRQSFSSSNTSVLDGGSLRKAAVSSSLASSEAALRSRHSAITDRAGTLSTQSHDHLSASSSSSRHFKTTTSSSSLILSAAEDPFRSTNHSDAAIFTSPDVQSLARTIDTDFAELENFALSTAASSLAPGITTRRIVRHLLSPVGGLAISAAGSTGITEEPAPVSPERKGYYSSYSSTAPQQSSSNGDKIRELLNKAQSQARRSSSKSPTAPAEEPKTQPCAAQQVQRPTRLSLVEQVAEIEKKDQVAAGTPSEKQQLHQSRCKAVMSESIERIDQRMSDLCKKLNQCQDTKEAIDLLKVMIQMIEKAWSVPVCGDDLGFKLCNSLREAGGLDIIVAFIHDSADNEGLLMAFCGDEDGHSSYIPTPKVIEVPSPSTDGSAVDKKASHKKNGSTIPPLWLNLSNLSQPVSAPVESTPPTKEVSGKQPPLVAAASAGSQSSNHMKDSDSDIITSDLGLDSTSVESLSYVSGSQATVESPQASQAKVSDGKDADAAAQVEQVSQVQVEETPLESTKLGEEESQALRKEELVFLSARLLSQCLTCLNRNYIVDNGLDAVLKLACQFTTMKSSHSQRLLSRSLIMRQSSSNNIVVGSQSGATKTAGSDPQSLSAAKPASAESATDCSDTHAIIGTEILQHLFKHSEDTCSRMISLGGLQAILYGCRSSNIETLRHCASALANLALYGGPDSQQMMIEQKAHVWLFPLAFHEDDNIQYYACLAIVVLVANQEIEADVLKSSTLDLVEPFVTSHEPRRFAESTTAHIHGQSASWLRKLIPLLESKRVEARNLACFHFAMEAHIKKEQGQTEVFKEIGAVEPLRKVASSPQAIASKFACQALRLIGEKEPHKLSQQVPLWTNEDVLEWLNQIGFERFRPAFKESGVDGDLLLQLEDEMLQLDLGIANGIIRRRFLRELANLKRIADYSSVDKTNLCGLLSSMSEQRADLVQYVYPLVQLGVTRENVHLLEVEQLLRECKISNSIHRIKLARALKELQDRSAIAAATSGCGNAGDGDDQKTLDVFVSYRRSNGSQLASLLKVHLQLRGFSVFIDVERLEAGKFDNNLLDSIKTARNFILVLSPNALDRCIGDRECKDWVHKEIVAALASNCNIIPIMDNFLWPDAEQLPEDMRSIGYFNGVRWYHDYQDACVDKVERFIRGEIYNNHQQTQSASSSLQRGGLPNAAGGYSSGPSVAATPSAGYSRGPFEADQHPLSAFALGHQYLQQHSATPSSGAASSCPSRRS